MESAAVAGATTSTTARVTTAPAATDPASTATVTSPTAPAVPVTSTTSLLAKASLLVGLVQLPFYGHLPQQLFILMSVIAFS